MSESCCDMFEKGAEEIDRFIAQAYLRNNRDVYQQSPFQYCPWCGSKLSVIIEDKDAKLKLTEDDLDAKWFDDNFDDHSYG